MFSLRKRINPCDVGREEWEIRDFLLCRCWVTVINVSWSNHSIFSDCLFVHLLLLRTFGVCQDARRTPNPLRLRTMSLSLIFYRFSRPNQPIFQRSGARDVTGLFKRCWERSIEDILLFIVCTHQWSASQRKHQRLQNIFFIQTLNFIISTV